MWLWDTIDSVNLTMAESSWADMLWKRLKKSWRVEKSRKSDLHGVGIWTVARSSPDSSVEVPRKLKERQAQASFSSQFIRLCCRTTSGDESIRHSSIMFVIDDWNIYCAPTKMWPKFWLTDRVLPLSAIHMHAHVRAHMHTLTHLPGSYHEHWSAGAECRRGWRCQRATRLWMSWQLCDAWTQTAWNQPSSSPSPGGTGSELLPHSGPQNPRARRENMCIQGRQRVGGDGTSLELILIKTVMFVLYTVE